MLSPTPSNVSPSKPIRLYARRKKQSALSLSFHPVVVHEYEMMPIAPCISGLILLPVGVVTEPPVRLVGVDARM